jgi:hypothetical protein
MKTKSENCDKDQLQMTIWVKKTSEMGREVVTKSTG